MSWYQVETFKRDKEGRVFVNPAKDFIQPFELTTDEPNQIVTIPASGNVGPIPLTARHDGAVEAFYVKAVVYDGSDVVLTTYDIDFELNNAGKRIIHSNRMLPLLAVAGDGGRPGVLAETIFIPAQSNLSVRFRNNDVAVRKVEFVLGGIKFYAGSAPDAIKREMFSYTERRERTYAYWQTTDADLILAASVVGASALGTTPDETDLEVYKLTAQSDGAFRCRITDAQNTKALMSGKVHCALLFGGHQATAVAGGIGGSGGLMPARWATSWLIRKGLPIRFEVDNLTASTNTVRIVLWGRKIGYTG